MYICNFFNEKSYPYYYRIKRSRPHFTVTVILLVVMIQKRPTVESADFRNEMNIKQDWMKVIREGHVLAGT
ncbi:unnamed protein product [Nezara viridula]|uniref:Uncharacterized protein n=1 Tax=Nezara viridula TaxID=85310 RepID=A0A9P0HAY8_NEZVI|nr:unnamed protein product [Nezara viridula]